MGALEYRDIYTTKQQVVTSDDNAISTTLIIKPSLTLDHNANYRAQIEINVSDLERKLLSGTLLVTGQTLLALAKKGVTTYRKALSFAFKKTRHE